MSDKLKELTDKLYNEGLNKGKEEGERILEEAKNQANKILAEAKAKAELIVAQAEKDASDLSNKAVSDIRMAAQQSLQATKKDIENLLVGSVLNSRVNEAMSDIDFVKFIIKSVAEKFTATESMDISLVLPEKDRALLEPWLANELSKSIGKGCNAVFSKKIAGGFTIGPSDGSYFISLTEETFNSLISEYLRPVTRKMLFGE